MRLRAFVAALFAVLLVSSVTAAPAAAAGPALNFSADETPNPYIEADTTISEYDMAEMDSPTEYYDDNGDVAELPAHVNMSQDNPFTVRFDQVEAPWYTEFPRAKGNVTAINNSEWTTSSDAGSSMAVSQTDGATADGVDSIEFNATVASSETAEATFANFSTIDQDPKKRVLQFVGNVDSLSSDAQVELRVVDSDGDYKAATINTSATASNDDVIGSGTGQGYVFQERLNDLSTVGAGDGAFDDIATVAVNVSGGDAIVTMVGLDVEHKSTVQLGETINASDERIDVEERNAGGDMSLSVTGLETLGSEFDDATIRNLQLSDVHYAFRDLEDTDDYSVEFSDADAYSYPRKLEIHGRLGLPTAIDLSHSNLKLKMEQGLIEPKYATVEIAEGVGDTDFANISSWTDKTDSFSSVNATHTLDDTVSTDKEYAVHGILLLQENDEAAMQPQEGGGGGFWGGGGNPLMSFFDWVIAGVLSIGGMLGLKRLRS